MWHCRPPPGSPLQRRRLQAFPHAGINLGPLLHPSWRDVSAQVNVWVGTRRPHLAPASARDSPFWPPRLPPTTANLVDRNSDRGMPPKGPGGPNTSTDKTTTCLCQQASRRVRGRRSLRSDRLPEESPVVGCRRNDPSEGTADPHAQAPHMKPHPRAHARSETSPAIR
jgi:hypothetical protein